MSRSVHPKTTPNKTKDVCNPTLPKKAISLAKTRKLKNTKI